jgi:hypothetical protein
MWVMDNCSINQYSQDYLGAQYYTSPANLVRDLREKVSLYSIRTESGHMDRSRSGDMTRTMSYELEFSTEGGMAGYISKGGQNQTKNGLELLPALYSPAVTTIRESVTKIQSDADMINQSSVAGISGRRSVIMIDPIKSEMNHNKRESPSKRLSKYILKLHSIASEKIRLDCTKPLHSKHWKIIKFQDPSFIEMKSKEWITKENEAAGKNESLKYTFYGRLHERVPAFAGMLAFADNINKPIITNDQYEIAEKCLYNEFMIDKSYMKKIKIRRDKLCQT